LLPSYCSCASYDLIRSAFREPHGRRVLLQNRFLGKKKEAPKKATLDDVSKSVGNDAQSGPVLTGDPLQMETRSGDIETKCKKLDAELAGYKKQLAKMKKGPARKMVEQRALRCLKQKHM
jgi:hypothetical protein